MAQSLGDAWRSFWHVMTSNDRHSNYDSPYRTGRHVPLANGQGGILTSVATATDSRVDITSPYSDETGRMSSQVHDNHAPYTPTSPVKSRPYSPGLRSQSAQRASQGDGFETQNPSGEIPMQSFDGGLPPPPPVSHSWKRIDAWAEENYPELYDQLCEGATNNDLNELEHQLDCSLPQDVRESLMLHDGQERGGNPTGIIFSGMLMDCEEIVQEWENWRKVNQEFLSESAPSRTTVPSKVHTASNQASSSKVSPAPASPHPRNWRQDLMQKQDCVPPNSIRKVYAHPAWIPLVRDWGGNNLAVDLAPGPTGKWGQIILFGRDYDTKYVVARSWAAFLALVSDDLRSGKWFVDEETNELKLREFKKSRVEPAYFDILRWRMDQKYGRRAANRKSMAPNGTASPTGSSSPYASPVDANPELRGRSMQRLSGSSPLVSPIRPGTGTMGRSSPLARVTEEAPATTGPRPNGVPHNLMELETPRPSMDGATILSPPILKDSAVTTVSEGNGKENAAPAPTSAKANGKLPEVLEEGMKTIEI